MDGSVKWMDLQVASYIFNKYLGWIEDTAKEDADRTRNDPERRARIEKAWKDVNDPHNPHNWRNAGQMVP